MARTKGALNKRTRTAMTAAAEGRLGKGGEKTLAFLMKMANDRETRRCCAAPGCVHATALRQASPRQR